MNNEHFDRGRDFGHHDDSSCCPCPCKAFTPSYVRKNLFDPRTIKKLTTITFKERLRLLLKPAYYSTDWTKNLTTITKYKVMDGKAYILNVQQIPQGRKK